MAIPSRAQIKVNALNRLVKEHELYAKEQKEIEQKLDTLTSSGGDQYEINKTQQILGETKKTLPRVRQALENQLFEMRGITGEERAEADTAANHAREYLASLT